MIFRGWFELDFAVGKPAISRRSCSLITCHFLKSFVFGLTQLYDCAVRAVGLLGATDLAAMVNQQMAEQNPLFPGDDAHEILFDLLGTGF